MSLSNAQHHTRRTAGCIYLCSHRTLMHFRHGTYTHHTVNHHDTHAWHSAEQHEPCHPPKDYTWHPYLAAMNASRESQP